MPANFKKMSYNTFLDEWLKTPIPDTTFEFWKQKGYFKKKNKKLNYGIMIGKIHRGNNKGKSLKDLDITFDIEKGTTFLPVYSDRRQDGTFKQQDKIDEVKEEIHKNQSSRYKAMDFCSNVQSCSSTRIIDSITPLVAETYDIVRDVHKRICNLEKNLDNHK